MYQVISGVIPPGQKGEVRFKTQANDTSLVPLAPVNSIALSKVLLHLNEIVISQTVSDNPYDPNTEGAAAVAINTPIICSVR